MLSLSSLLCGAADAGRSQCSEWTLSHHQEGGPERDQTAGGLTVSILAVCHHAPCECGCRANEACPQWDDESRQRNEAFQKRCRYPYQRSTPSKSAGTCLHACSAVCQPHGPANLGGCQHVGRGLS